MSIAISEKIRAGQERFSASTESAADTIRQTILDQCPQAPLLKDSLASAKLVTASVQARAPVDRRMHFKPGNCLARPKQGASSAMWSSKMQLVALILVGGGLLRLSTSLSAQTTLADPKAKSASSNVEQSRPSNSPQVCLDLYGDPLPANALARMGTFRLRHNHPRALHWTAFSPDGKLFASCGLKELRLWDLSNGKLLREFRDTGRPRTYYSVVFAPDGSWLAGLAPDAVCIWNLATGQRPHELPMNAQVIVCSPDGKRLVATFNDGSFSVWDTATGKRIAQVRQGHTKRIFSAVIASDGTDLVTMSEDNLICHWDLHEFELQKATRVSVPPSCGLYFSPDGRTLVAVSRSGPISLWNTINGKERFQLQGDYAKGTTGVAFSADGQILATNASEYESDFTQVALWEAKTGRFLRRLKLPARDMNALHFSSDGRVLMTTSSEPVVRLWNVDTAKEIFAWPAHTDHVLGLAFTPDGRLLVSGSHDGTVRSWDVASGRQVRELAGHRWRVNAVAITRDGKTVVSGGADGTIRIQDLEGAQRHRVLLDGPPEKNDRPIHSISQLALMPDGKTLVTQSWKPNQGIFHIWNMTTGKEVSSRPDDGEGFTFPQLFSNAPNVLESWCEKPSTDSKDGRFRMGSVFIPPEVVGVIVRELTTNRELLRLRDSDRFGGFCEVSPDGKTFVSIKDKRWRNTWNKRA